jgi:hypothetical protein
METYSPARHGGRVRSRKFPAAALLAAFLLEGCAPAIQPLAVALAGAGTSSAVSYSLNGTVHRTFSAPLEEVKTAALDTFSLMGIRINSFDSLDQSELIKGATSRRDIEVELEPISSKATRMRVVVREGGLFYDSATATEIVLQTEKALGVHEVTSSSTGAGRPRK